MSCFREEVLEARAALVASGLESGQGRARDCLTGYFNNVVDALNHGFAAPKNYSEPNFWAEVTEFNFLVTQAVLDGPSALADCGEMTGNRKKPQDFMGLAFETAEAAAQRGEVPVGAVVVDFTSGEILATAGNEVEANNDPTAHAEILAIRAAGIKAGAPRLTGCDLYVTLEPCAMCAAAISLARLRRVIFGAYDPKGGGVDHGPRIFTQPTCHHRPEVVGGVDECRSEALLKDFFAARR